MLLFGGSVGTTWQAKAQFETGRRMECGFGKFTQSGIKKKEVVVRVRASRNSRFGTTAYGTTDRVADALLRKTEGS